MQLLSSLLIQAIHDDHVAQLQYEMATSRWRSQQPSLLMPLRLWTGEALIRMGKWVKRQGAGEGIAAAAATTCEA
jgi:hypothetical protein